MTEYAQYVFIGVAAIIGIFLKYTWKKSNWLARSAMIVGIILAALKAYNDITHRQKEKLIEKIQAKVGEIYDLYGATYPTLQFGDSGAILEPPSGIVDLPQKGQLMKIWVEEGKLYVYVVIWDRNGNAIAVIDRNIWTLYNEDFEYNNNETAFELVTKGDRKVYFQIRLKDGIAHFRGLLLNKEGYGMNFIDWPDRGEYRSVMVEISPDIKRDIVDIHNKRIFQYPRELFFGKLEE